MKLHQLSIFLENKPGQLLLPCKVLGDAGINIVTMSLADAQQFGIVRLLVGDWRKAKEVLEEAGCVVKETEVVAVATEHRPGGLAKTLKMIEDAGVSVEYVYAFPGLVGEDAVLVFRFEDTEGAIDAILASGVRRLTDEQIEKLPVG